MKASYKMYIEIHDWKKFEQKIIYFKLNNALNMQINNEANYKFKGVYAIYKEDICLYVGQSNNLASRVATHLSGKYKNATHFKIWDCDKFDVDLTLDQFEQWLMAKLKPTDNLDIDMSVKFIDIFENNETYHIIVKKFALLIYDRDVNFFHGFSIYIDSHKWITKKDLQKFIDSYFLGGVK